MKTLGRSIVVLNLRYINVNSMRLILLWAALLFPFFTEAFPTHKGPSPNTQSTLQSVNDQLILFKHEIGNHEQELQTIESRLENYQDILDALQSQQQAKGEQWQSQKGLLDEKCLQLEKLTERLITDVQQLRDHLQNSQSQTVQLQQQMQTQQRVIESLQHAIHTIADALQVKIITPATDDSYEVQPGDTLEKIAKKNKTTVSMIKELNHLSSDRIKVGQSIKLPSHASTR